MKRQITAGDIMSTALITATPDELINATDVDMRLSNIHHIPVVDDAGALVGIVSSRDLARGLSKKNHNSTTVEAVMTWEVETATVDTPIDEVIETLIAHKIGCLPIVGSDRTMVGIVTETDCLRVALALLREAAPRVEHTGYAR